jgi:Ribbon-helix-helix protein, copG family
VATTTESSGPTGTIVQSWVPVPLAEELKQLAEAERRSISATIRNCLEDRLRDRGGQERRP